VDYKELLKDIDMDHLPAHVAIIMDGNGRWAKKKHRNRLFGHYEGARALRQVVEAAVEIRIGYMTVYAFSTENWNRPEDEVKGLMKLLRETLLKEIDDLHKNNVVVRFIGSKVTLGKKFWDPLDETCSRTWNNTGLQLNVAFNYGGKQELLEAFNHIMEENPGTPITDEMVKAHLYTAGMPDPDLVIRTSGELRLSNFLIWQTAYSEFYVTETLWPDFRKVEFMQAIIAYQKRNRRYGAL